MVYISYVGKLFLRMLKALILPLIVPSLIASVGSLDMSLSKKVRAYSYAWKLMVILEHIGRAKGWPVRSAMSRP